MNNSNRIEIFRWFGFPIRIDLSWLVILVLITYSLAAGYFPFHHPGLPVLEYWILGFVSAIGLFFSVLFHEMSHALVARHYQLRMDGITLFIFGGVAEMKEEPHSPKVEFLMAVAGPISSLVLSGFFFAIHHFLEQFHVNPMFGLVFYYLGWMNLILALFNLVPAFPLDGGRIFRSILWSMKNNFLWATHIASLFGRGFGWMLIIFGGMRVLAGFLFGGFWYILIGFFLKRASQASEEQVVLKSALEHVPVTSLMHTRFTKFNQGESLLDLTGILTNQNLLSIYPVTEGEKLIGYLSIRKLNELTRESWNQMRIGDIFEKDVSTQSIDFKATAWEAFQKMFEGGSNNLFVTDQEILRGIVTVQDMVNYVGTARG